MRRSGTTSPPAPRTASAATAHAITDCYVTRMRQRAAESDIVIVNHHLLCADAAVRQSAYGEVIPECHYAVLDEAHQLEDVATQYFGRAVSNYRIEDLARDLDRAVSASTIPDRERADDIATDVDADSRSRARCSSPRCQMLRIGLRQRRDGGQPDADPPVAHGQGRRRGARADRLRSRRIEADIALAKDVPEEVLALGRRAKELRDDLTFLLRADDPAYRLFPRVARPRRLPARVADRRLRRSSARCCWSG